MVEKLKRSREELTECRQSGQRLLVASGRNPNRPLLPIGLLQTSYILVLLDILLLRPFTLLS